MRENGRGSLRARFGEKGSIRLVVRVAEEMLTEPLPHMTRGEI